MFTSTICESQSNIIIINIAVERRCVIKLDFMLKIHCYLNSSFSICMAIPGIAFYVFL